MKTITLRDHDLKYTDDIDFIIETTVPIVEKFYADNGIKMVGIVYDSKSSYDGETKISFNIVIPENQYYPEFYFKISKLSSAVSSPKHRLFEGTFIMRGVSKDFRDEMFKTLGLSSMFTIYNDDSLAQKKVSVKLEHIFTQAAPKMEQWKNFGTAHDVFIF